MTTLSEAMYDYLSTLSVGDHVYPWRLPKNEELPAITFQFLPGPGPLLVHDDAHDGSPAVTSLFLRQRVQWDIWATTYEELDTITQEFRHAMHGFRGDMGGLDIGSVHLDIELDSYEEDVQVYRKVIDGMIRYNDVLAEGS